MAAFGSADPYRIMDLVALAEAVATLLDFHDA